MTPEGTLRVAVFGATGKIGRLVVEQLLAAGHRVTAYVRTPGKLTTAHPDLTVIQGELNDRAGVARAVAAPQARQSPTAPATSSRLCRPLASAGSSGWRPRPSPTLEIGPHSMARSWV